MNKELQEYVEREIVPRYETFDAAHRVSHVRYVMEESMRLAQFYDVDEDMVYAIAAFHDTGLVEGRERHHIVSGQILHADEVLKRFFTPEQIVVMSEAVEDHRASAGHEPRSIYGRIVAEADRQIDGDMTLRRMVQYGLSHYPDLDKEQQYNRMLAHLAEKYAEGGYLKLYIPESANAEHLAQFRALIADAKCLRAAFERIFAEETAR
ncbi:MAG: HD domain-containing protein [Muribaculaceae bacterium]